MWYGSSPVNHNVNIINNTGLAGFIIASCYIQTFVYNFIIMGNNLVLLLYNGGEQATTNFQNCYGDFSYNEIIKLNSLKDNFIYVGDKLVIRSPFTPTPVIPTSTPTQLPSLTPISSPTINGSAIALDVTLQTSSNFESVNNNNTILISIIIFTVLISGLIALTGNKGTKN